MYVHSLQYSKTLSVDACPVTYFPGHMMVYALTLNTTTVWRNVWQCVLSICFVNATKQSIAVKTKFVQNNDSI